MKGTRRGYGDGSLTIDAKTGKWIARLWVNGERVGKTFLTRKEGSEWLRQVQRDADQGVLPVSGRLTLSEFLHTWLATVEPSLKPKTVHEYRATLERYVLPTLGRKKLTDLLPEHLSALYNEKLKAGLSGRTVQIIHAVLRRALKDAVRWRKLSWNICETVPIPRSQRKEMAVWTVEQVQRFLDGVLGDRLEAAYRLALTLGLREGELAGLQWGDLDFTRGTLQIVRTLQRINGQGIVVGEPKSLASVRLLVVPGPTLEALRNRQTQQVVEQEVLGDRWPGTNYIFTTQRGKPFDPVHLYHEFRKVQTRLGLPRIPFHGLRHTCATLLFQRKVHGKLVQALLGHSTIGVTLDLYSHVIPGMTAETAEIMGEMFSRK